MSGLCVFDLDGTLIDSRKDIALGVNLMRDSFGLRRFSDAEIVGMVGNGVIALVQRALADTNGKIDFDEALKRDKQFYAEHLTDNTGFYPGILEGLKKLHEHNFHLAVISNKPTQHSRTILTRLGAAPYLDEIWGGDCPYPLKPEPDSLLALQKRFGVPAEKCWMLGDHYTDLEAGRRAGFHRALARWGFGDPKNEMPEFEFHSFAEFAGKVLEV